MKSKLFPTILAAFLAPSLAAQINIGPGLAYTWPAAGAQITAPQQLDLYLIMNPYGPRITSSTLSWTVSGTAPSACTFKLQGSPNGFANWTNLDGGSAISCTSTSSETITGNLPNYIRIYFATFTQGDSTTRVTFAYAGTVVAGTPISIASGGTGATTAAGALANLGGQPVSFTGTTDPPGNVCTVSPAVNLGTYATSTTDKLYQCLAGTWTLVGGGSGTFVTLSGDATSTATGGATTVVGIENHPIAAPTTAGYMHWSGSAWEYTNPAGGGITGSGATNNYTLWNGASSVANGTIDHGLTTAGTDTDSYNFAAPQITVTGNCSLTGTAIGCPQFAQGTPPGAGTAGLNTLAGSSAGLGENIGTAAWVAFLYNGGPGGTPSSLTLTNASGLPLTTGVTGILPVANGGNGTASPGIVAGANVTVTGTWPTQTVAAGGSFTAGTDLSGTNTSQTVIGILGSPLPSLSTGNLNYNGSSWAFTAAGGGTVTHTASPLTANKIVIGNGGADATIDADSALDGSGNMTGLVSLTMASTQLSEGGAEGTKPGWFTCAAGYDYDWLDSTNHRRSTCSNGTTMASYLLSTDGYALLASPALSGVPTAPTAAAGVNSTQVATTAYSNTIYNLIQTSGSPYTMSAITGTYWNNTAGSYSFDLPTPVAGLQLCFGNYQAHAQAISLIPGSGVTIFYEGVAGTAGSSTGLVSGATAGAFICLEGTSTTTYMAIGAGFATWTNN